MKNMSPKASAKGALTLFSLVIGVTSFGGTPASAATNVVPDQALRTCVNQGINFWAAKWKPEVGNRADNAPVSKEDIANYMRIGTFSCDNKGVQSLEGLQYATGLTSISIKNDVNSSYELSQRVSNIEPLLNLTNLKTLNLSRQNISTLPDMSKLVNLTSLNLEGNGSMTSEQSNSKEKHNNVPGLSDISALKDLKNLQQLNVNYSDISSLKGLESLTQLKSLYASHNKIKDLEPLRSLNSITDLRVDSNSISDISPVENLANLQHFEVQYNNHQNRLGYTPSALDISALANKTQLTELNLANNTIEDISALGSVTSLVKLDLRNNKIADLSPVGASKAIANLKPVSQLTTAAGKAELAVSPQYPVGTTTLSYIGADGKTHIDISALKAISGANVSVQSVVDSQKRSIPFTFDKASQELILDGAYNRWVRLSYEASGNKDTVISTTDPMLGKNFADVASSHPFKKEISWLAAYGITTGYSDGTYRPDATVNRDAMAAFFYRLAGSPEFTAPAVSPFTDVKPGDQFYKEITWMASQGITTGYADGTFRPTSPVNRDAMAAFFYRFAGKPAYTPAAVSSFKDIKAGDQFYTEVSWLASTGITQGWPDGTFRPTNAINRDAMAAFIYRYKNK